MKVIVVVIKIEQVEPIGHPIVGLLLRHNLFAWLDRDRHTIERLSALI